MSGLEASSQKPSIGTSIMNPRGGANDRGKVAIDLLCPRYGEQADDPAGTRLLFGKKSFVEPLLRQFIEIWMADIVCSDATFEVPALLERKSAEDVIDVAAHLLDAPASPGPELRRHKIKDGNA